MVDYKLAEMMKRQENTRILRSNIASNKIDIKLKEKIDNFCDRRCIEYELVKYKILTDDLFILFFIKDPGKQSIHQKLASEYLEKVENVYEFSTLPANGKNALYVINGMVLTEEQANVSSSTVKSIDFEWKYLNQVGDIIQCYASHKYTNDEGGGQDNQYKDIISFLENSQKHKSTNTFFYAICDGKYYQRATNGYMTRMEYLNNTYRGNRTIALTINDIEQHMLKNL